MRFVTLITPDFVPGLRTLVKSLKRYYEPDKLHFTVLHKNCSGQDRQRIIDMDVSLRFIALEELGEFRLRSDQHFAVERFKTALQKLLIFKLPFDEKMCWIDADFLCVGDPRQLDSFEPFTATMVFGISLPAPVLGRPMFSSGLFIFRPSSTIYTELQEFALDYHGPLAMPDQFILNAFFWSHYPNDVHLLGIEWEMLKRVYVHHPKVWQSVVDKKFIHFVGKKPWMTQDPGYGKLDAIWRQYA